MSELVAASNIWSLPFLGDVDLSYYPELILWRNSIQLEIEMLTVPVACRLVKLLIAQSQPNEAVRVSKRLLSMCPYEDEVHHLYLQSLIQNKQFADAMRHLHTYWAMMKEEFPGYKPSPALQKLGQSFDDQRARQ